jgi:hypothetical protein
MSGPGSGQSFCGCLCERTCGRRLDRASGDAHGRANTPACIELVKLRLAWLSKHFGASVSRARLDGQTRTSAVGGPLDGELDANRQAS